MPRTNYIEAKEKKQTFKRLLRQGKLDEAYTLGKQIQILDPTFRLRIKKSGVAKR